jgi:hypothetical protein
MARGSSTMMQRHAGRNGGDRRFGGSSMYVVTEYGAQYMQSAFLFSRSTQNERGGCNGCFVVYPLSLHVLQLSAID